MAWLDYIRLDTIPVSSLVLVGWLLVTGSIGELWRLMIGPRSPWLVRVSMPLVIVAVAVGATFLSLLVLRPLGLWMGFGKAVDYWLLVVLFLAPFDIWPVPWNDDPRAGWRANLRNVGLKLLLPIVLAVIGLAILWLYSWASLGIHNLLIRLRMGRFALWFSEWFVLTKDFDADRLTFDQPWLLLLALGIPVLFFISYRSLAALGKYRRVFALGYRGRVLLLMILALAGVQLQKISERMTVMYLLDQSESIPKPVREAMIQFVMQDVDAHRHKGDLQSATEDKAGVIVFGREATIEHPPFADSIRSVGNLESLFELRTDATNIGSALKLAQAAFPEDSAKRIVIITDGNENLGDSRTIASGLAENGIGIDVVAVRLSARNEVAVEKVSLPSDIRRGQPLEARIVVQNYGEQDVKGRLRVVQNFNGQDNLLQESEVTLKPGKNVFAVQHTIDVPAGYTYGARFIPDANAGDAMEQNNSATAFTHVRGKGRVLMIVDAENPKEFDPLIGRLGELNMEVDTMPSDNLFTSLAQLQGYDCIVLANVARSSGGDENAVAFTDDQIAMLVRNTEQFGCGLVMIGGPNAFGAGGWANTEIEKAMPVDFQIKNSKVKAVGALVLLMHACEIPDGNNIQKKVAEESVKVLGPMDYCGLLQWENFTGGDNWLWFHQGKGLVRVGERQKEMASRIGRMTPGDMPDFDPAMTKAIKEFETNPASVKHMIVISDGDPSPPSGAIMQRFKNASVTVSTVAIGSHGPAESGLLQRIANQTGGKYYAVNNPKAIPKIFQRESRRVARPLILEERFQPYVVPEARAHEMLQNIDGELPELTGFVMTTVKENPLVEVLIRSPKPGEDSNATILASWTYGAGKTCVFTSDGGQRWANSWTDWENYNKFYSQMIRWAMRPVNEAGKFTIATEVKDGKVKVVVTALKEDDEFLNFLNMSGVGADPELKNLQLSMQQEAPGRYVGEFDADKAGSYLLAINTGMGGAPLLTGITVPYSAEYRERESNEAILTSLASYKPKGGEAGKLIDGPLMKEAVPELIKQNDTFRRTLQKANSSQDIWPAFLLLAGCVFLADVFVRRVQVNFEWVIPGIMWTWHRLLRREPAITADERMDRLRNLKATVSNQLDERRAAARFEPQVENDAPARDPNEVLREATAGGNTPPIPPPSSSAAALPQTEQESYTERLLAAKKKLRKDPPS
ncbi:von Willebrand factor type A domain protein [Anatilimnocola aggregata]|uniref:von Willebrand factor type A domain protein n=1 Tax=Anatilimnocola aggregata TaxID=2528021 RepID=A0A517YHZ5_9BACT|nr:VWA domain-containing protein [Anatilimnocola aggregata]QDU29832.1 von Willebrand factor type A domain protein [Anatilimnocola aggregata]